MANHSMHESSRGADQESWRDSDTNPLLRSGDLTQFGATSRRESAKELAEAVPVLHALSRQQPDMPSAAQWAAFTRELSRKLDEEAKVSSWRRWRVSFHDRLAATDSRALRVGLAAAVTAAVAAVLAALLWIASQLVPPTPSPSTASASPRPAVVRTAAIAASATRV